MNRVSVYIEPVDDDQEFADLCFSDAGEEEGELNKNNTNKSNDQNSSYSVSPYIRTVDTSITLNT